jgi:hypothetical protein
LKAINPKSQVLSSRAAIPSSKLCALAFLYLCLSVSLPTGPIGMSDLSEMQLRHSLSANRSDSCDHELGMTGLPKMQLLPLLSQQARFLQSRVWNVLMGPKCSFFTLSSNRSGSCDQEFGMFSSVRNSASSLSLPMVPILEIKSLKCLIYPQCRFFTLSSNRSGSCDQELGMLDLSEMQFHCLPTDPILAIKSLESSDLSEIRPIWRSRAWSVLIRPKRSFFTLSSDRSNSCDHELGMSDLSEMQLQ